MHKVNIFGESFTLVDDPKSLTISHVLKEMKTMGYVLFMDSLEQDKSPIILDLGAHVGMFSCLMAKKFPNSRILAIEATKKNCENLFKSIMANHLENIEIHNVMLWRDKLLTSLLMDPNNTGSASIGNYSNCEHVEIGPCLTLNEFFEKEDLKDKLDSITLKMDIERAEYDILPDFKYWDTINKLLIEIHWKSLPPKPSDLADSLNILSFLQQKLPKEKIFATLPFEIAFHAGAYLPIL